MIVKWPKGGVEMDDTDANAHTERKEEASRQISHFRSIATALPIPHSFENAQRDLPKEDAEAANVGEEATKEVEKEANNEEQP